MTDIFPNAVSDVIEILGYPKDFKTISEPVSVFVLYVDTHQKVYFAKRPYLDHFVEHLEYVGKGCRVANEFQPNSINWQGVFARFRRTVLDTHRRNVDLRAGFKIGNKYLVKAYFTFGVRTVDPGTAHLFQLLNVPLLFFLRDPERRLSPSCDRYFPYQSILKYDRRILLPNANYLIPEGTTYMIFSTQKNYFSVDVVRSDSVLPFETVDPVATRVTKLPNCSDTVFDPYARPVATPFIEDTDPFGRRQQQQQQQQVATGSDFVFQVPYDPAAQQQQAYIQYMFQAQQEEVVAPEPAIEPREEPTEKSPRPTEEPPRKVFVMEPAQPREIVVACPDFLKAYQMLKSKTYDDPRQIIDLTGGESTEEEVVPLDLSLSINLEPYEKMDIGRGREEEIKKMFDDLFCNRETLCTL